MNIQSETLNVVYLSCGVIDDLLCSQVALVTDKKLVHVFTGVTIDFLQPLLDIVERLLCDQHGHAILYKAKSAFHPSGVGK